MTSPTGPPIIEYLDGHALNSRCSLGIISEFLISPTDFKRVNKISSQLARKRPVVTKTSARRHLVEQLRTYSHTTVFFETICGFLFILDCATVQQMFVMCLEHGSFYICYSTVINQHNKIALLACNLPRLCDYLTVS